MGNQGATKRVPSVTLSHPSGWGCHPGAPICAGSIFGCPLETMELVKSAGKDISNIVTPEKIV